jgi:hypothetical protein
MEARGVFSNELVRIISSVNVVRNDCIELLEDVSVLSDDKL